MNSVVTHSSSADPGGHPDSWPSSLVIAAEQTEAAWMATVVEQTSEPARSLLGTTVERFAGGVVLSAPGDETRFLAKAVGFGLDSPLDSSTLDHIIAVYRRRGDASATLQVAPQALPADWAETAESRGLAHEGAWAKHAARLAALSPASDCDLDIRRVPADRIGEWGAVVVEGMGMPDLLGATLAAGARTKDIHAFGAFEGEQMVAGALLGVRGASAGLGAAATLPGHRNRGAQRALIAARITAARALGCEWVFAETDSADADGHSRRNLVAAGLEVAYERPNWIWRA